MIFFHTSSYKDVVEQALFALADNKLRTLLSVIGVAVGIAAVMMVGTVSQGIRGYVYTELETYGLKSIWIYRDWGDDEPNRVVRQGSGITNEDYRMIKGGCCPAIRRATPVVYSSSGTEKIRMGSQYFDASMEGVGIEYTSINNDQLLAGRNFRKDDIARRKPVAIVGPKVIKALYGDHSGGLGRSFRFNKQKYKIIGILNEKNRDLLTQIGAESYDINGRVLIPYSLYQNVMGSKDIHTLQAEAFELSETQHGLRQIIDVLNRKHNRRFEYKQETMQEWINTAESVLKSISLVGLAGAFIALVVGGMGIMNIMSTSVIERTREIGIRKAMGAQSRDILIQFLMESGFVSAIGGFIGMLAGVILSYLIAIISGYPLGPSWLFAAIAMFVSLIVGVISGYYPAYRAANLKPVDALRYE